MQYTIARKRERKKEEQYRIYVTDALRLITENTSKLGGQYMTTRFFDVVNKKKQEKPKQSAKQIADNIITRLK